MAITRTCQKCGKKYKLPHVDSAYAGQTIAHLVTCPHCYQSDGEVQAPAGTSVVAEKV